jgi:hypothetical protein
MERAITNTEYIYCDAGPGEGCLAFQVQCAIGSESVMCSLDWPDSNEFVPDLTLLWTSFPEFVSFRLTAAAPGTLRHPLGSR